MNTTNTSDNKTALAQEIAGIALHLHRMFLMDVSNAVSHGDVSIQQYMLMSFLVDSDGLNMSTLAKMMHHTTPATTGLVERLVQAKLVRRFQHDNDRRQVLVKITDKGRELVDLIRQGLANRILKNFELLVPEDIVAWGRIYRSIYKDFSKQTCDLSAVSIQLESNK